MVEQRTEADAVRCEVVVDAASEFAFDAFTRGLTSWWPREYTWAREVLDTIAMEPRAGGRCYEVGPHGFICDWGRVLECERPRGLLLAWQVGPTRVPEPDPARASEVEVRFAPEGEGTRVKLVHRGFERHGEGADEYRRGMGSPSGWRYILARFAEVIAEDDGGGARGEDS